MSVNVEVVATSSLGDRSYLAHDGAVAVDPQRDVDRVVLLAGRLGVHITHVAETHLYNDYVSGGRALARLTGAAYLVAAGEKIGFDRVPVAGGSMLYASTGRTDLLGIRAGRRAVCVDDEFDTAAKSGLRVTAGKGA